MRRYNKGWKSESARHSLAARRIKTGRKIEGVAGVLSNPLSFNAAFSKGEKSDEEILNDETMEELTGETDEQYNERMAKLDKLKKQRQYHYDLPEGKTEVVQEIGKFGISHKYRTKLKSKIVQKSLEELRNYIEGNFRLNPQGSAYLSDIETSFNLYGIDGVKTQIVYVMSNARPLTDAGKKYKKAVVKGENPFTLQAKADIKIKKRPVFIKEPYGLPRELQPTGDFRRKWKSVYDAPVKEIEQDFKKAYGRKPTSHEMQDIVLEGEW